MTAVETPPRRRVRSAAVAQVRAVGADSLYRNSFMLMANTAVQAALGSFFWLAAARRYSEGDVGLLAATLSATLLIGTASCLGFPNALVRYLPRRPGRSGEIAATTTVLACAGATAVFGLAAVTPWALPLIRGGRSTTLIAVGLATVVLCAAGMICDAIFIAQRSSHLLLVKNTLGGIAKVVAVLLLPGHRLVDLAVANIVGLVVASAATVVLLLPRLSRPIRVRTSALDGAWTFSFGNHIGMVFGILPVTATPLIVLSALGARSAAYFGMTMIVVGLVNVVPSMMCQSLFAELSASPKRRREHILKATRAIYVLLAPCVAVIFLAAHAVLAAFGPAYAAGATGCLRWMAIGSLVASVNYLVDVTVNSLGRAGSYVVLNASNAFLVLGAVALAAPHGLAAVGLAWFAAQSASVAVALVVLAFVSRPPKTLQEEVVVAPGRLPFLDGLRGAAAAFVVLSHSWSTVYIDARRGRSPTQLFTSWLGLGHYAVSVFIVISGFSLGLVAWRGGLGWPGGMRAFFKGRFRRIVPTYWAAVAISAAIGATVLSRPAGTLWDGAIPIRLSGVVSHALLLQDVRWAGPAGSTAFWSLAVEWHIYLVFPLLLLFLHRWPQRWLLLVLGAGIISAGSEFERGSAAWSWIAGLHPSLYGLFVLGLVSARYAAVAQSPAHRRAHERRLLAAAAFGLLLAAVVSARRFDPVSPVHDLWFGPLAVLWIGRLAAAAPGTRRARSLLERPTLVWLGLVSYSLYLVHAVVIEAVWRTAVRPWRLGEPWPLVLELALGLAASIVAAGAFHHFVERRFTSKPSSRDRAIAEGANMSMQSATLPSRVFTANARLSRRTAQLLRIESDKPFWQRFERLAAETIGSLPAGATVVDLGGGRRCVYSGAVPAGRGIRMVAVDISGEELAANRDVDETAVADVAEELPFADASIDLVLSRALLEHVDGVPAAAEHMGRVLKPGGVALHFVPGRYSLFGTAARILPFKPLLRLVHAVMPHSIGQVEFDVVYDHCYPQGLESAFRRAGFREVSVEVCYAQPGYFESIFPLFLLTSAYEALTRALHIRRVAAYSIVRAVR